MEKNNYQGKFIVFDGLDGCGKTTQIKLLIDYFKNRGVEVETLHYPDYDSGIGKLIHQFLYKEYDFSPEVQFLLYFADFIKDKEKIQKWLEQGKVVIADRYFTTTIAYQCLKGFSLDNALKIAEQFNLLKPDLIFYIDIPSDISMKRKFKEKGKLDRHEEDKKLLTDLRDVFKKLVTNQTFSKWIEINGEASIQDVFEEVKKYV